MEFADWRGVLLAGNTKSDYFMHTLGTCSIMDQNIEQKIYITLIKNVCPKSTSTAEICSNIGILKPVFSLKAAYIEYFIIAYELIFQMSKWKFAR